MVLCIEYYNINQIQKDETGRHTAHMGRKKCTHRYWSENLTETDLGIDGRIIMKWWQAVMNTMIET